MKSLLLSALLFVLSNGFSPAQEVIVLGGPGQGSELGTPGNIREGRDGNISVYDQADAFIKVYSPKGEFVRKLAGEGQGPGEIQRRGGGAFGFTPDGKLFFTDFFSGP